MRPLRLSALGLCLRRNHPGIFSDEGHREHPLALYVFTNDIGLKNKGKPTVELF